MRLSSPTQVFCELAAAGVGLVDLVVAGDAMVKKGLATLESLRRSVDGMSGAGVRVARRALSYVRAGVDSPMESRLRMLLVLAGFPEPQVNVILRDLSGDWSRRFDLCYLALKLIIEYDGEQHGELGQRDSDIHRREELERLGYTLVAGDLPGHLPRSGANSPQGGRCPARGRWARTRSLAPRMATALSRASVVQGRSRLTQSGPGVEDGRENWERCRRITPASHPRPTNPAPPTATSHPGATDDRTARQPPEATSHPGATHGQPAPPHRHPHPTPEPGTAGPPPAQSSTPKTHDSRREQKLSRRLV